MITPYEAALAGLLHDIGKLVQRAHTNENDIPPAVQAREAVLLPEWQGGYSHRHALWSDAFFEWTDAERLPWPRGVDVRNVRDAAVFHHRPGAPGHWLVTVADRLSAGSERKRRDEEDEAQPTGRDAFRRIALRSTVAAVDISLGAAPMEQCFAAMPLSADALLPGRPDPAKQPDNYAALWRAFQNGYRALTRVPHLTPDRFEQGLLALSEQLLWAVPSSTIDQPDISLHDHARTVAAIAACLAAYHAAHGDMDNEAAVRDQQRPKFHFIELDLSGIQRTLLRLQSQQVRGGARILRARSFLIGTIVDAAALWLRQILDLPAACVLQAAGGHARLLAPALPDFEGRLRALREASDRWLVEAWQGDLALHIAASPAFGGEHLHPDKLPETEGTLFAALDEVRLQPLAGFGTGIIQAPFGADGQCVSCGARPALFADPLDAQQKRCSPCHQAHALGRALPKAAGVAILPAGDRTRGEAGLFDRFVLTTDLPEAAMPTAAERIFAPALAQERGSLWRPAAYVPRLDNPGLRKYMNIAGEDDVFEPGDLKTFAHIAADALEEVDGRLLGRDMLAVVKADVDRLGMVFGHGLRENRTPARVAQLSRLMDAYFSVRLPVLLERHFPNTYTVYAGGDDLLLVAPWRFGPVLALGLREDFGRFTAGNRNLTLSAGVAFVHPQHPLNRAVGEADTLLDEAKEGGRDRVGLLGRTLTWEMLRQTLNLEGDLCRHIRADDLGTATLHHVLSLIRRRAKAEGGDTPAANWAAHWAYTRKRMLDRASKDRRDAVSELLDRLLPPPGTPGDGGDAESAVTFALWRNRRGT